MPVLSNARHERFAQELGKGKTADEIEASLNADERAVAEEIRAINDELTPKAQYVAGVIRGVPFRPFSQ